MVTKNRENVNNAAAVDGGVNNETLADIVAEMRDEMTGTHYVADGMIESLHRAQSELRALADRIEAAWKRDAAEIEADALAVGGIVEAKAALGAPTTEKSSAVGNTAAMREALKEIDRVVFDKRRHTKEEVEAHRLATEALTVPPRNCDVGTAEEQAKRLNEWCNGRHCVNCQFKGGWPDECKLRWVQMPYEEGGAK